MRKDELLCFEGQPIPLYNTSLEKQQNLIRPKSSYTHNIRSFHSDGRLYHFAIIRSYYSVSIYAFVPASLSLGFTFGTFSYAFGLGARFCFPFPLAFFRPWSWPCPQAFFPPAGLAPSGSESESEPEESEDEDSSLDSSTAFGRW